VTTKRRPAGVALPTREEAGDALAPEDVLALVAEAADDEFIAAELSRVGEHLDRLAAKQPKELQKQARRARVANAQARWQEVKAFMRPLVAQGKGDDEILEAAEAEFHVKYGYCRATLRRRGLTGLRKELWRASPT
jgi:hypothetical protein